MKTILQIIPSLGAGGAEQACVDVAIGLKAEGYRALVVSSGGHRVDEIKTVGGEHIQRDVQSKNPLRIALNAFWLADLMRKEKVSVVHARSRAPAWSAYWASQMTGVPFVTTNHAAYKFSNNLKKLYNSVMVKADRIIAISDFIAQHIQKHYGVNPDKIRVIPRGIDLDKFAPEKVTPEREDKLRQFWGIKKQRLVLVPSRLSPIKGQAIVIEALALLPPDLKDVTAIIVGDDQGRIQYRQDLNNLLATHGLQDRIKLVNHCMDMPAAYHMATLVIAPSLIAEGFGRVPVEAMAMGVPVIATELGGFIETVIPGANGWLVPPNDAKALANMMIKALTQKPEDLRAGQEIALRSVHKRYSKEKMVADTLAVYSELARHT